MKPIKILFFVTFVVFYSTVALAQQKINFLNGKIIPVKKVLELRNKNLYFINSNGNLKSKSINKIFSFTDSLGKEKVIYRQDTGIGYDLTVPEMANYVKGEQDANLHYKSITSYVGGFAFGVMGGFAVPLIFPAVALIPPAGGMVVINAGNPNILKQPVSDQKNYSNMEFINGYTDQAKTIKLRNAAIGSTIGLISTIVVLWVGKVF